MLQINKRSRHGLKSRYTLFHSHVIKKAASPLLYTAPLLLVHTLIHTHIYTHTQTLILELHTHTFIQQWTNANVHWCTMESNKSMKLIYKITITITQTNFPHTNTYKYRSTTQMMIVVVVVVCGAVQQTEEHSWLKMENWNEFGGGEYKGTTIDVWVCARLYTLVIYRLS